MEINAAGFHPYAKAQQRDCEWDTAVTRQRGVTDLAKHTAPWLNHRGDRGTERVHLLRGPTTVRPTDQECAPSASQGEIGLGCSKARWSVSGVVGGQWLGTKAGLPTPLKVAWKRVILRIDEAFTTGKIGLKTLGQLNFLRGLPVCWQTSALVL